VVTNWSRPLITGEPENLDEAMTVLRAWEAGAVIHCTPTRAGAVARIIEAARDVWIGEQIEKDHQIREMVDEIRDTAIDFRDTEQLRDRIAAIVVPHLRELVNFRRRNGRVVNEHVREQENK
jgi:hypothetical protein